MEQLQFAFDVPHACADAKLDGWYYCALRVALTCSRAIYFLPDEASFYVLSLVQHCVVRQKSVLQEKRMHYLLYNH